MVTVLTPRSLAAEEPTSERQEAKRERDLGVAASDRGDFAAAIEHFRHAYARYPSPNMFYNLGVALDRLGRPDEAVEAFERFLEEAPAADPLARRCARERIDALKKDGLVGRSRRLTSAGEEERRVENALEPAPAPPLPAPGPAPPLAPAPAASASAPAASVWAASARLAAPANVPRVIDRQPRRLRLAAIGVGVSGVALLAGGAGFAALTASTEQRINHPRDGAIFDLDLVARGHAYQAAEQSLFTIGGAAVATSLVLELARLRRIRVRPIIAAPTERAP